MHSLLTTLILFKYFWLCVFVVEIVIGLSSIGIVPHIFLLRSDIYVYLVPLISFPRVLIQFFLPRDFFSCQVADIINIKEIEHLVEKLKQAHRSEMTLYQTCSNAEIVCDFRFCIHSSANLLPFPLLLFHQWKSNWIYDSFSEKIYKYREYPSNQFCMFFKSAPFVQIDFW